ncbi:TetR/AcrR family transcriptional regulator [Myxococcota bacterium]|nr:TetR/AcrR family transcriptional regulator [Myxococcota bacterium]
MPPRVLSDAEIQSFRDSLCRVAAQRFAESGFAGVTLRSLAQELRVSPMTPYRYFRNKEEIWQAVRTDAFRRFGMSIEAAAHGIGCPLERIQAIGRAYLHFAQTEPHAYRIMFQLDPPDPNEDWDPLQEEELRRGWLVLRGAMEDGVRAGLLRGDPDELAHLSWISVHGLATLHLAGRLRLGRTIEDLVEPVLDSFFHGSAAPGSMSDGGRR